MSARDLLCQECGLWFQRDSLKGRVPIWCSRACKKRAYRRRIGHRDQRDYRARKRAAA